MPIADVGPIFERINSRGTPLTIVDLMRAATWSDKFDLFDQIDALRTDIQEKDFGKLDRKVILRNLSAAAGGGFSEGSIDNLRRFDADDLIKASEATRDAYKRVVDFLSSSPSHPIGTSLTLTRWWCWRRFSVCCLIRVPSNAQRSKNGSGERR